MFDVIVTNVCLTWSRAQKQDSQEPKARGFPNIWRSLDTLDILESWVTSLLSDILAFPICSNAVTVNLLPRSVQDFSCTYVPSWLSEKSRTEQESAENCLLTGTIVDYFLLLLLKHWLHLFIQHTNSIQIPSLFIINKDKE